MSFLIFVFFIYSLSFTKGDNVVLKPTAEGKTAIGLVMIQGAGIKPDQYTPLMKAMQQATSSKYSLWIGVPEFMGDYADPLVMGSTIDSMIDTLQKAGMLKNASVFVAGHSLGGFLLQSFVKSNPKGIAGMVLMGAYLSRGNYNTTYPVPSLTIGGELDGLSRVTRIMEGYYHQVLHSPNPKATTYSPVVVVEGLSHMQFASGEPPSLVRERDLQPEISYDNAHQKIANLSAAFIALQLSKDKDAGSYITKAINNTLALLNPLLTGFQLEGFAKFKPPCYDNPPSSKCTEGCPWTPMAQQIMGGLLPGQVANQDQFHPVYQIPVHLPKIDNNCTTYSNSCVLHTHTVTQGVYEEGDKLDTGYFPVSASELRCKLSSRQAIMQAAGMKHVDFNKTDGSSICKNINEFTYARALNLTAKKTRDRFEKLGQKLVFGEDLGPYNAGPLWIWDPLKYKSMKDPTTGREVEEIRSPMMRTPTDYIVSAAAGFHYCKLLSPARAMEWIYVDGLRAYDSLK